VASSLGLNKTKQSMPKKCNSLLFEARQKQTNANLCAKGHGTFLQSNHRMNLSFYKNIIFFRDRPLLLRLSSFQSSLFIRQQNQQQRATATKSSYIKSGHKHFWSMKSYIRRYNTLLKSEHNEQNNEQTTSKGKQRADNNQSNKSNCYFPAGMLSHSKSNHPASHPLQM